MPALALLVPGLFGPVPLAPEAWPAAPALGRLLGRADRRPGGGAEPIATLLHGFGLSCPPDRDSPSAPFARLADLPGAPPPTGWVWHADPVHLRPESGDLVLFDAPGLDLRQAESEALAAAFNRHFAGAGWRLEVAAATRWYLHAEVSVPPRTTPLHAVVGRGLRDRLPRGAEAGAWNRMLNETQMLFHHAEVNRRRIERHRPPISGFWPWGGGTRPAAPPPRRYARVYATEALALGLAAASGAPAAPLPDDSRALGEAVDSGPVLVFWDRLWRPVLEADGAAWAEELGRLDRWARPLLAGSWNWNNRQLDLYSCAGEVFSLDAWSRRRFWRRARVPGNPTRRNGSQPLVREGRLATEEFRKL